jgi:hypothetical protein
LYKFQAKTISLGAVDYDVIWCEQIFDEDEKLEILKLKRLCNKDLSLQTVLGKRMPEIGEIKLKKIISGLSEWLEAGK